MMPGYSGSARLSATRHHSRATDGPGPAFLNAPGQADPHRRRGDHRAGTPVDAGVITADGAPAPKSVPRQRNNSLHIRSEPTHPTTVELDGLGRYRVIGDARARPGRRRSCTGLPTSDVDDTLVSVLVIFCVVGGDRADRWHDGGHLVIIRRQLAPAVKGFRSGPAGRRPRARPRRGAAAHADRQRSIRPARTPRSASSAPR